MLVSYPVDLIKQILVSDYFQNYRNMAQSDELIRYEDFNFVPAHRLDDFLKFINNLLSLEEEYRLDYIKEIHISIEDVGFMTEITCSSQIEGY